MFKKYTEHIDISSIIINEHSLIMLASRVFGFVPDVEFSKMGIGSLKTL